MIDYHDERPTRERPSLLANARSMYGYAIGVLLLLAAVAAVLIWYTGSLDQDLPEPTSVAKPAPTAQATSSAGQVSATARPSAVAGVPSLTATLTPQGKTYVKVANTGGSGVNMRTEPGLSSQVAGAYMDGAILEVLGPDVQRDERTWRNVKDKAGNEGWIAADFLVSAQP